MAAPYRRPGNRRRDRHGRGLRGPLVLPRPGTLRAPEPVAGRARRFADVVLAEVSRLERRLGDRLDAVEFGVEEVPGLAASEHLEKVPLAVTVPGANGAARVVVFRRAVELRAADRAELAGLVREALAEQVGALLGRDPDDLIEG